MRLGARFLPVALVALVALSPSFGTGQPDRIVPAGEAPARADVRRALDDLATDPNLAAERTVNMLRFKEAEPVTDEPWWWQWANAFARWFRGFFEWVAVSGRYVAWVLGALAAGLLALYVARLIRTRGLPRAPQSFAAPSHVRDLDIRPESLPEDVGAAALALWQSGEQRAALALLYRGLLSRLVHVHAVPIRASSTEGECLAFASERVPSAAVHYASRLVAIWTAAVYGARQPTTGAVRELCAEFTAALEREAAA